MRRLLSDEIVREIHSDKRSISKIAKAHSVGYNIVYRIKAGLSYKHLHLVPAIAIRARRLQKVLDETAVTAAA